MHPVCRRDSLTRMRCVIISGCFITLTITVLLLSVVVTQYVCSAISPPDVGPFANRNKDTPVVDACKETNNKSHSTSCPNPRDWCVMTIHGSRCVNAKYFHCVSPKDCRDPGIKVCYKKTSLGAPATMGLCNGCGSDKDCRVNPINKKCVNESDTGVGQCVQCKVDKDCGPVHECETSVSMFDKDYHTCVHRPSKTGDDDDEKKGDDDPDDNKKDNPDDDEPDNGKKPDRDKNSEPDGDEPDDDKKGKSGDDDPDDDKKEKSGDDDPDDDKKGKSGDDDPDDDKKRKSGDDDPDDDKKGDNEDPLEDPSKKRKGKLGVPDEDQLPDGNTTDPAPSPGDDPDKKPSGAACSNDSECASGRCESKPAPMAGLVEIVVSTFLGKKPQKGEKQCA